MYVKQCVKDKAKQNRAKKDNTVFSVIYGYLLPIEW